MESKGDKKIKKIMSSLKEKIELWAHQYYVLNQSEVSDAVYDAALRMLAGLESAYPQLKDADSPVGMVMGSASLHLEPVQMKVPMLSLTTYTDPPGDKAMAWLRRVQEVSAGRDPGLVCEPKYDGLAVNARYVDGRLVGLNTRGDGVTGENVITNSHLIFGLDMTHLIDAHVVRYPEIYMLAIGMIEMRGEVVVNQYMLEDINKYLQSLGKKKYATCRSAASGILRSTDSVELYRNFHSLNGQTPLSFRWYGWGDVDPHMAQVVDKVKILSVGSSHKWRDHVFKDPFDWIKYEYETTAHIRHSFPYPTDGIVFKVTNREVQRDMGLTGNAPRWAYAQKFEPESESTVVTDIIRQVGRTGRITPVAIVEPVVVGGVMISRCSLHNEDEVQRLGIYPNADVLVHRAGDTIPEIASVIEPDYMYYALKHYDNGRFTMTCPECGSALHREDKAVDWYCTGGIKCPAQLLGMLIRFCEKKAINVDNFGEDTLERLAKAGMLQSIRDFFHLSMEGIRLGLQCTPKTAERLYASLQYSRKTSLHRVIYALGIVGVGFNMAVKLAKACCTLKVFSQLTMENLIGSHRITQVDNSTANAIIKYLSDDANQALLYEAQEWFDIEPEDAKPSTYLNGISVTLTGEFDLSRQVIQELVEYHGGEMVDTAIGTKSILICGKGSDHEVERQSRERGARIHGSELLDYMVKIKHPA